MINKRLLFITWIFPIHFYAQHTFYFIGDAGKDTIQNNALKTLNKELMLDSLSSIIFLGDNIYYQGLELNEKSKKFRVSEKKIHSQLQCLDGFKGNAFFIPGNHDWRAGKIRGKQAVLKQSRYVENYLNSTNVRNKNQVNFLPTNACPGPESVLIDSNVRLIFLDLQWFLQQSIFHSVGKEDGLTKKNMIRNFYRKIDSILIHSKQNNELVFICAHHPLFSNGKHGQKKTVVRLLGTYTPLYFLGGHRYFSQDLYFPRYKKVKSELLSIFSKYENLIYISGHDHNAQYFTIQNNHYFVSGNGSKKSAFGKHHFKAIYQNDTTLGYLKIQVFLDQKWTYEFKEIP